jgi:hypothetical protein
MLCAAYIPRPGDRDERWKVAEERDGSLFTFYRIYPGAPAPRRADAGLGGSMPARAYHYCEPFTAATGFGWHLFPPIDFELLWDGTRAQWRAAPSCQWRWLDRADLPGLRGLWKLTVPVADQLPVPVPFLEATRGEPGTVQIWTGYFMRSRPGWATLVRGPANLPPERGYEVLEGLIETDWFFGPVMSVVRLRRSDVPVEFRTSEPLYQVQPVHKCAYAEESLGGAELVKGSGALSAEDWRDFTDYMVARNAPDHRVGWYKAEVRKRRKRERSAD